VTTITSLVARTVAVPVEGGLAFSTRAVTERHYVLVQLRDADGTIGIGFCYAGNFGGTVSAAAIRELIAPFVVGEERHLVKALWEELYARLLLHGRTGLVMRAMSAVDIAIWDCNARAAHTPLWRYLGAASRDSVPAYASGGYYRESKGPHDLAQEVGGYVASGFRAVKIKVGLLSPEADEERIAAVRAAVGPDVLVMLDANNAWRDVPTALRALRRWEPYDPYWIEEPFGPDDVVSHARLARRTPLTVATGEIEAGRWRHRSFLDAEAVGILQTDAAVCGGITEFQRIASLADAYGVPICPHWFHDLHAHLVASTPNGLFVEFFPDDSVLNFRRLITPQLEVTERGELRLPLSPGLGFDFVDEAVERYAIDEWS
jgi:L-alanine-DL-glutamate epimerase-like enolase superfamily enzyme